MDATVVDGVVNAISNAVAAYGSDVLTRSEQAAAGASFQLARRLFAKLRRHHDVTSAVALVAAHPGDQDYETVLRSKVKKAIEREPELAAELADLLGTSVTATGDRTNASDNNRGIMSTGDNTTNIQFKA